MTIGKTFGVHHVGLTVKDVEETAAFFVELLGFSRVRDVPEYPAVFVSDGTTMLTLWQAKEEDPTPYCRAGNIGLHHLALRVENAASLSLFYEKLTEAQVQIEFAPCHVGDGPAKHMMFYEPGGIRIELFAPPA